MSRFVTIAGFALCGVLCVILYITSKKYEEHIATLAQLLDQIMSHRATRIAILVFWWWLGWHFLYAKTV